MRHVFVSLALLWSGLVSADAPRIDIAPAPNGPAATVAIVQPRQHAQLVTHRTASPSNKYDSLTCLLETKDQVIRLSTSNGSVNGVLVVVDGMWATVVHDLTKPIRLAELQPFSPGFVDNVVDSPMSRCGWHWIAAVPTGADGRMLAVEPVVNWYYNVAERNGETLGDPANAPTGPLVVVNWPLVGRFFYGEGPGTGPGTSTGYIAKTPDRVPFDYNLANGAGCQVELDWGQLTTTLPGPRSLAYISGAPRDEDLLWKATCESRGNGASGGQVTVYSKPPKPIGKQLAWPVSGKQKVDDNYFGENKDQVNQQIRKSRCNDGHKESCD